MMIRRIVASQGQFVSLDDLKVRIESNVFACNDELLNTELDDREVLIIVTARDAWQIILDDLYWVEEQPKQIANKEHIDG